jgi:hypothetical protein
LFVTACRSESNKTLKPLSREEEAINNLDSFKKAASAGDLIVRLGDDVLSYQIKNMNDVQKDYSHAGIIVEKEGIAMVAHIAPEENNSDTIQYIPIDSFLIPAKNIGCALYRYNLTEQEKSFFVAAIDTMKTKGVHFDWLYNLETNDKMYCSEMISKALKHATRNRINCKEVSIPNKMLPLLVNYFKGKLTKDVIAARKIMTIDNLYLNPECSLVMKFRLKYFPGE